VLEERNASFLRQKSPPQEFGDADRERASAVSALSAKCRAQLNALLEGANQSDGEKAYMAYGALRAECEAAIKQLARAASAELPERRLSTRARSALDQAMGKNPDQIIADLAQNRKGEAPYDTGEIIEFGLRLADVLGGIPGVYSSSGGRTATPTNNRGTTYGQGSPTNLPRQSRQPPSDITGTGR
jgi:hypothetical protein